MYMLFLLILNYVFVSNPVFAENPKEDYSIIVEAHRDFEIYVNEPRIIDNSENVDVNVRQKIWMLKKDFYIYHKYKFFSCKIMRII